MTRTLHGLTWDTHRGTAPLRAASAAFTALRPDVEITWTALPWQEFKAAQIRSLAGDVGTYDLIMFDQPWTGDYASRRWLIPLQDTVSPGDLRELADDLDPHSLGCYTYDDALWGWPVDGACQTLAFRPDLVDDATSLDTWDELLAFAQSWSERRGGHAMIHSLATPGNLSLFILSIAAALGDHPCGEPGAGLRRESLAEGIELVRRINQYSMAASDARERPWRVMRKPEAPIAAWPAAFPYLDQFVESPNLAISAMPYVAGGKRTNASGGVGLGVAANGQDPQASAEFAWFAMSKDVQGGTYVASGGQPSRQSALRGSVAREHHGENAAILADLLTETYVRPHWPGWTKAEHTLGELLLDCVAGRMTVLEVAQASRALGTEAPS